MGLINYITLLLDIIIVQSNLSNVTLSGTIQVTKCCLHELILEFAAFFINCVPTKYFNCFTKSYGILWMMEHLGVRLEVVYYKKVLVKDILVRILDYVGVRLERFNCTLLIKVLW